MELWRPSLQEKTQLFCSHSVTYRALGDMLYFRVREQEPLQQNIHHFKEAEPWQS